MPVVVLLFAAVVVQGRELHLGDLYDVLGQDRIIKISSRFYDRVYADPEDWFREIFTHSNNKERAIENQSEWLVEWFGGPHLYTQKRNLTAIPSLQTMHARHRVSPAGIERWLMHMRAAVHDVVDELPHSREIAECLEGMWNRIGPNTED